MGDSGADGDSEGRYTSKKPMTYCGGRDHGKLDFDASFSRNSFNNWSAVPKTPIQNIRCRRRLMGPSIPFRVAQKIRIGFPTEYSCNVAKTL